MSELPAYTHRTGVCGVQGRHPCGITWIEYEARSGTWVTHFSWCLGFREGSESQRDFKCLATDL